MPYTVGSNMPGFLPDTVTGGHETFDDAKACLIHDLKFAENYADTEAEAEEFCAAAEDVNLWSSPSDIVVAGRVFFIGIDEDDESDDDDQDDEPEFDRRRQFFDNSDDTVKCLAHSDASCGDPICGMVSALLDEVRRTENFGGTDD